MDTMRIDLHAHSTASDGTDTPAGLVRAAAPAGLDVVAITDHDTTAGWAEAADAVPPGLTLVPGAELSTVSLDPDTGRRVSVHLLAYLFDPTAAAVVTEQTRLRKERRTRLRAMAERMAADGLPIDADEVFALLPEDSPAGRPHLAQALVRAGLVASVDQAFAEYLGAGRTRELAAELGLLVTGSSDYHGTNKTIALGQETTDPEQFEELVSRATGSQVVKG